MDKLVMRITFLDIDDEHAAEVINRISGEAVLTKSGGYLVEVFHDSGGALKIGDKFIGHDTYTTYRTNENDGPRE